MIHLLMEEGMGAHHSMVCRLRVCFCAQEVLQGAFREGLGVGGIVGMGQCMCDGVLLCGHLHAFVLH